MDGEIGLDGLIVSITFLTMIVLREIWLYIVGTGSMNIDGLFLVPGLRARRSMLKEE